MNKPPFKASPSSHDHLTVPKLRDRADNHRRTLSSIDTQGDSRNSSGRVWEEDYCEFDFGIEGGDETKGDEEYMSPESGNFRKYSAEDKELPPIPPRTSFTSFLPTFRNSKTPESPTKSIPGEEDEEFMPTFTGDRRGGINVVADRSKGLASWFTGSSAPVAVGIPTMDEAETSSIAYLSTNQNQLLTPPTTTSTYTANIASRFNIFASPKTPSKAMNIIQLPADLNDDELLTVDIEKALFPSGKDAQDPFSPASFNNLLMNAEGLLLKIQTGYKLRTLALHELSTEKETLAEELDEIKTRADVFKIQMEDMVHQFTDKDETIAKLKRELALERQFRREEQEAREKSIALVRSHSKRASDSGLSIDTQLGVEELGVAATSTWRRSGTTDGDSDAESGADSVFSRSLSPALTTCSSVNLSLAGTESGTPELSQAGFTRVVSPSMAQPPRPKVVQQRSTFQKILTGMKAAPPVPEKDSYDGLGMGLEGCSNCRGQGASVAWDTVGLMRAENKGLKERVGDLETAVDEVLDLCYGLPKH